MSRAAVLLLLLVIQDADLETLVQQLSDEKIEVRDRAAAALVQLGDKGEERLRKVLAVSRGERKTGIESVLRTMERNRKLREILPPPKRVTIDLKEKPLEEVVAEFRRQTGWRVGDASLLEKFVTVAVRDVPPHEALDAICREAKLGYSVTVMPSLMDGDWALATRESDRTFILTGRFAAVPRAAIRQYSASITELSLVKRSDFSEKARVQGQIKVRLEWPLDMKPVSVSRMEVKRIVDDQDAVLYDIANDPRRLGFSPLWFEPHEASVLGAFKFPDAKSRALKSVQGTAVLQYPIAERVITFAEPAMSAGKSQALDGREVTLDSFSDDGTTITAVLVVKGEGRIDKATSA